MNRVELTGRVTADPELKYTESNRAYTRFCLAVNRNFKNKDGEYDADFFNIVAWEKRAEVICQNIKKGNRVGISGKLQTSKYQKQDGTTGYQTDVIIDDFDFLESKPREEIPAPDYNDPEKDPFADFGEKVQITDNDLPF